MALDTATVARVARLARIKVDAAELEPMAKELSQILTWFEELGQVDTSAVEPMARVIDVALPMREDTVTDGGKVADILKNAPDATEAFFTVPKVVE